MPAQTTLPPSQNVLGPLFGSCTDPGPVGGEVVACSPPPATSTPDACGPRNNGVDCRAASLQYAGLRAIENRFTLPEQGADDPVTWRLSINLTSGWVLPSQLLQASGRTWLACIAAPSDGSLYSGRLAGAFEGAQLPDEFGTCWNSRAVSASVRTLNCSAPHLAELISFGFVPDRSVVSYQQIQSSCEQLAARVLDRADPTAGGVLTLKTSPERISLTQHGLGERDVLRRHPPAIANWPAPWSVWVTGPFRSPGDRRTLGAVTVAVMNRPLAGVVLLVLTVVAVTVVPMINGRRVAGSGAAVEFPAPPQVGDCVVPPFPADNVVDRLDPEVRVTAIKFGPCTGAKFGEVVALSDANTIGRENRRIPSRGVCSRQIAEYAGLTTSPGSVALPGESTSGPMAWMPTIGSESYLIVPSLREQSAGHNWVACLAAATNQRPVTRAACGPPTPRAHYPTNSVCVGREPISI